MANFWAKYLSTGLSLGVSYYLVDHWRQTKVRVRLLDPHYHDWLPRIIRPDWLAQATVYTVTCSTRQRINQEKFVIQNSAKLTYQAKPGQVADFQVKPAYSLLWQRIKPPLYDSNKKRPPEPIYIQRRL